MPRQLEHVSSSLVIPAIELVAAHGLDALTLRPLAEKANMSLATVTKLVGSKSELVRMLINEARVLDGNVKVPFERSVAASRSMSGEDLAELCDLVLETQATEAPRVTIFLCEMLLAAANDPVIAEALEPWIDDQIRFWWGVAGLATNCDAHILSRAMLGLSIDEMAHGSALEQLSPYRRLRRLALRRLCHGPIVRDNDAMSSALFDHCFDALGDVDDPLRIDKGMPAFTDGKAERFAIAAAKILVELGAGAVTHRSVAAAANTATSTLAYHCRTREDLIRGAMVQIIRELKQSFKIAALGESTQVGLNSGYDITRSTFALALEASRNPLYLGTAADMRRKRGINYRAYLNQLLPDDRKIDALGAQTLSIVSMGTAILNGGKGAERAAAASRSIIDALLAAENVTV